MNRRSIVTSLLFLAALACRRADPPAADAGHAEAESWAVTAWGQRYEVFAETDALVAGRAATSNAHVTVLADFSPLKAGAVSAVLRDAGGRQEVFRKVTVEPLASLSRLETVLVMTSFAPMRVVQP